VRRTTDRPPSHLIDARRAEDAVAHHLEARGFEILARNLRLGRLEIDIVARLDALAVMVEVRTRGPTAFEGGLASVAGKKKMHLLNAADRLWRHRLSKMPGIERMRIDVASVTFEPDGARVEYITGAITA
jgi:putative endonuclease